MSPDPEKIKLSINGIPYIVQRAVKDQNIYRLSSLCGNYLIARDFYGIWVELTSTPGSPDIPLNKIGQEIESYYKILNLL
jgi:hypothetical protein